MRQKSRKPSLAIAAITAATLFAKALGLLRSALMASTLGDLPEAAAFAAASGIPGALFDLFFSAAITGTFIPAYSSAREESEKSARDFFRAFLGISLISSALLALTGAALAPAIISLSAPRLGSETARLAAELLRIIFPSAVFTAVTYTLAGLLQARGSFVLPASVSIASNAFIVLYLLLSHSSFSVHMLAAVYLISWLIQAVTLSVPLLFRRLLPLPTADIRNKHLKKAFSLAPKITAGAFLAPASVLAAAFFCSFASEKAFVIYGYAVGIYTVAAGISVFGVGSTCFPALSESFARGEHEIFAGRLRSALFSATLISIPVFCAVAILAPEGVSLLYERGSFTAGASEACAAALRALSPAIPAYAISEVLYRAFLAAKKPKLTALAALFSLAALVASNVISLVFDGGLTGVCISFTVAECVRALFLFASAKKDFPLFCFEPAPFLAFGGALCFAAMALYGQISPFFSLFTPSISNFLKITIVFTAGVVVYLLYILVLMRASMHKSAKKEKGGKYYAEKKQTIAPRENS